MAGFPRLKTGSVLQYPAGREVRFSTRVLRFVDGGEQRFRQRAGGLRRWQVRLDLLDEGEMAEMENFFFESQGRFGTFSFTDPWDGTEYANCSLETDEIELHALGEMRGRTAVVVRENVN